jgi:hypothetical protein
MKYIQKKKERPLFYRYMCYIYFFSVTSVTDQLDGLLCRKSALKVIGPDQKNQSIHVLNFIYIKKIRNEDYDSRSKSAPGKSNLLLPHTTNKMNEYR